VTSASCPVLQRAAASAARDCGAQASVNTLRTGMNPVRVGYVSGLLVVLSAQMFR